MCVLTEAGARQTVALAQLGQLRAHDRLHRVEVEPAALEREALDCFDAIAKRPDIMLEFRIEPGEAVFQNNFVILHARSAFEDGPGQRRHLLRLWLDVPNGRPAPGTMHLHSAPGIQRQAGKTPTGEGDAYKALVTET